MWRRAGSVYELRRGWVSSQQLISPPRLRMLRLLPDLIKLMIDLSEIKNSATEIISLS
jgi:hypothetical protein